MTLLCLVAKLYVRQRSWGGLFSRHLKVNRNVKEGIIKS